MNSFLYLDSADVADAREGSEMGYVTGVTTNPTLMAKVGGEPLRILQDLLAVRDWPVFYQPGAVGEGALSEARAASQLDTERVVVKLPASSWAFPVAGELRRSGCRVSITAVYTVAQAVLAAAVGAESVIIYVDRARRLMAEGGQELTCAISRTVRGRQLDLRIVAASIRSRMQVEGAFEDGADIVTAPLTVLREMAWHELTEDAVAQFARDAATSKGLFDARGRPGVA